MACIETGRWVGTDRKHSLCQICHSDQDVEDEQHFLFDCPAYSNVRSEYATMVQHAFTAPDLITQSEPNVSGGVSGSAFPVGRLCYLCSLLLFQPLYLFGPHTPILA